MLSSTNRAPLLALEGNHALLAVPHTPASKRTPAVSSARKSEVRRLAALAELERAPNAVDAAALAELTMERAPNAVHVAASEAAVAALRMVGSVERPDASHYAALQAEVRAIADR
eukprot:1985556-Prymnesium_polylepis.1